jgi:glycerol-1-phosphate dehydrogenase [NAD(P)+]
MLDFQKLISEYQNCPCGQKHECAISDIQVGRGMVRRVGEILQKNHFPHRLLLVADETTLRAADGILESLNGFDVTKYVYESIRVATMDDVRRVESYFDRVDGVLAVGTGSVHDPCRLACARRNKPLCLFGTAPSMDGFASYSAPIVDGNFKITYPAKCPEVIIADTEILAASPARLKAAGFGDMMSKYIALIDWRVSHLLTGENYCERVAALTREAADRIFAMADKITLNDPEAAGAIFESLLMTGVAMSFTKTSRPGSGTEHIMAHFWECMELLEGKTPNFHGEDVGVTTLIMLKRYGALAERKTVRAHKEQCDWEEIYRVYGPLAEDVRRLNTPDTITDPIDPREIEKNWPEIVKIVRGVPGYDECLAAMKKAGCRTTIEEVGKSREFVDLSIQYHPYMRRRLSLERVSRMLDPEEK